MGLFRNSLTVILLSCGSSEGYLTDYNECKIDYGNPIAGGDTGTGEEYLTLNSSGANVAMRQSFSFPEDSIIGLVDGRKISEIVRIE